VVCFDNVHVSWFDEARLLREEEAPVFFVEMAVLLIWTQTHGLLLWCCVIVFLCTSL